MEVSGELLRNIHLLHCRIKSLRERLELGPKQLQARRNVVANQEQKLKELREEVKKLKVRAHEKEVDRKAMESRIEGLGVRINMAKSNEEYKKLVAEREALSAAAGALEDEILDLLERQDDKERELKEAEVELKRLQAELAEFERAMSQERGSLADQLAESQRELAEAESQLPFQVHEDYRHIVSRRGHEALAAAENNTCTGCFTTITPQMKNELLANEFVLCKSCGRILYLKQ